MQEFPSIYKKTDEDGSIAYYKQNIKDEKYKYTEEVKVIRDLVKQHIKTYGAVSANIYINEASYYNPETGAYNYNNYDTKEETNHVITIVGWDDEYSVENYKEGIEPNEDGAWIALNSYGNKWGDEGYMYISYEDACVEEVMMGIKEITEFDDGKKDYGKIYQHDELGMNMGLPFKGTSLYAANKYTREDKDKEEYLQEVGLYIFSTCGVNVYVNAEDDDIEKATLRASSSGALETGYHTIKLPTPVKLTGEKFVIKVEYINQEGTSIPIECNFTKAGINGMSNFYDTATANKDECYIYVDIGEMKGWYDLTTLTTKDPNTEEEYNLKDASTCIKAFTTYNEEGNGGNNGDDKPTTQEVERIELNETDLEVEVGDKFNLEVTFYPSNATNKNVTWKTSNKEVAVVDKNGIITAIAEGTAVITAITEDGNKTASCKLTVEPKDEDDPDNIYSDDDDYDYDDDDFLYDDEDADEEFEDNTIYKGDGKEGSASIPKTGNNIIFIMATALTTVTVVATIAYQKYKRLKGIK